MTTDNFAGIILYKKTLQSAVDMQKMSVEEQRSRAFEQAKEPQEVRTGHKPPNADAYR
ncbi:MAG: hypothetical protein HYR90_04895 [Candidatus Andersenbacteria bacterium]|nr:hypothetical protein [Candidatus Andersenbacteria bacterium]MBI3250774.1 hypothetical protein [Candidatus Andersenbacteria bacterium]